MRIYSLIFYLWGIILPQILLGDLDWGGGATEFRRADGIPLSGEEGIAILLSIHKGEIIDFSQYIPIACEDLFMPGSRLIQGNNENIVIDVSRNFVSGFLLLTAVPDSSTEFQMALDVGENEKLFLLIWDQTTFQDQKPSSGSLFTVLQLFVNGNSRVPATTFGSSFPLAADTIFPDESIESITVETERTPVLQPFTITLFPGWNLISVPNDPVEPSPQFIFGDSKNKSVWNWDGNNFITVDQLQPKLGFWVYHLSGTGNTSLSQRFEIKTKATTDRKQLLHRGWNSVGPIIESHIPSYSGLSGNIWYWNGEKQNYQVLPDNSPIILGVGYMLYSVENTAINLSAGAFLK